VPTVTAPASVTTGSIPSNGGDVPGSSSTTTAVTHHYSGTFDGQTVSLTPVASGTVSVGSGPISASLTAFATDDPAFSCLTSEPSLQVWTVSGSSSQDVVVADQATGDCVSGSFVFAVPAGGSGGGGPGNGSTTTTSSTIPSHSVDQATTTTTSG
jgi:hypothetical protein